LTQSAPNTNINQNVKEFSTCKRVHRGEREEEEERRGEERGEGKMHTPPDCK